VACGNPNTQKTVTFSPATEAPTTSTAYIAPTTTTTYRPTTTTTAPYLSNDRYYTNVDGNTVHSPAIASDGQAPSGATAQCGDGTYSFSQHRSGTCSHHGGVSRWL
jgi:hypothetical protein